MKIVLIKTFLWKTKVLAKNSSLNNNFHELIIDFLMVPFVPPR